MRYLHLRESGQSSAVQLSHREAVALRDSGMVVVSPTPAADEWLLQAARKVGVVRLGDLQVTIAPKISIARLIFLIGYSRAVNWRDEQVLVARDDDLLPAIADAFARLAQQALDQGLLHGYRAVEESLPVLRGRIRESEQLRRRYGQAVPLEVVFDDFTVDIAENQLLLAATECLLRVPGVSGLARQRLLRLRVPLADVTPLARGLRPRWTPSRLNRRYQPALRLAQVVLSGYSFEHRFGDLAVSGYTFDLWKIYEDFLTAAFKAVLSTHGGTVTAQDRWYLDRAESVAMRPDMVWYLGQRPRAVIDAKYKAEKPAGFPDADLYQMLAYCTALGLSRGHIVYAKGEGDVTTHEVSGACVSIHCHAIDLAQDPADVLQQVAEIARYVSLERTA